MDVRGDFSTDVATNGRRDFALDLQWDPNRNPQQKLTVKTSFEPSSLKPDDWTGALVLSYPGSFIRGNIAALTQSIIISQMKSTRTDEDDALPFH